MVAADETPRRDASAFSPQRILLCRRIEYTLHKATNAPSAGQHARAIKVPYTVPERLDPRHGGCSFPALKPNVDLCTDTDTIQTAP